MSGDHNANQKATKEEREYHRKRGAEILAQIQKAREPKQHVSERSVRVTIGMMRTLARNIPISPFHLRAADQMERMLDELLRLRKKLEPTQPQGQTTDQDQRNHASTVDQTSFGGDVHLPRDG